MRAPDFTGMNGAEAWRVPNNSQNPDHQGSICLYLIKCPWGHPFWQYWALGVIHLRDIPGVKPAFKKSPEMTHELYIFAINPEKCPDPNPDNPPWPPLAPMDLIHQFQVPNDQYAGSLTLGVIKAIMKGYASPDSDYASYWKDCINITAQHYRDGKHPNA